jgi:hypothetical protein
MAVIWGLDLKELQWGKFKGSYMFNQVYYLRRTKMIVYQIAVILCIVSESILTSVLSSVLPLLPHFLFLRPFTNDLFLQTGYVDQQHHITTRSHAQAHVHNSDFVGIASYNVIIGIAVPVIFGAGFFLDLFWPERRESKSVKLAWKICSIVVSFMALADAIALTVRCLILFTLISRANVYIHRLCL